MSTELRDGTNTFGAQPELPKPAPLVSERLQQVAAGDSVDEDAAQRALCSYVRALREAGARPEEMVAAVSDELEKAGLYSRGGAPANISPEKVVRWCLGGQCRDA